MKKEIKKSIPPALASSAILVGIGIVTQRSKSELVVFALLGLPLGYFMVNEEKILKS